MHFLTDFYGFPGLLAILFSLLFGVSVGLVNGFFTVTIGVPSFITTLGTGFILLGLIDTTSHDQPAARSRRTWWASASGSSTTRGRRSSGRSCSPRFSISC